METTHKSNIQIGAVWSSIMQIYVKAKP